MNVAGSVGGETYCGGCDPAGNWYTLEDEITCSSSCCIPAPIGSSGVARNGNACLETNSLNSNTEILRSAGDLS